MVPYRVLLKRNVCVAYVTGERQNFNAVELEAADWLVTQVTVCLQMVSDICEGEVGHKELRLVIGFVDVFCFTAAWVTEHEAVRHFRVESEAMNACPGC